MKADLEEIFGEEDVATDTFTRTLYSFDLAPIPDLILSFFKTVPDAVVRPENTGEVSDVVRYARENKIPIVPRGSACSGYGGAIPVRGGIVLDLVKMDKILDIDAEDRTVTVQSGLFYQKLLEELESRGLTLFTYPSSAPVSTIGGWLSTGGYGIGSLKYGHVSDQIVEMEAVLANGEVVHLTRETPQDGGYTLDWLIGSEGTLGIITEVTLRIKPQPEAFIPHAVCFDDINSLHMAILELAGSKCVPYSIEYFDGEYLDIKRSIGHFAPEAGAYAVLGFEGTQEEVEDGNELLSHVIGKTGGEDLDLETAEEEWEERFYPLRIGRAGPTLFPGDIIIPLIALQDAVEEIWRMKRAYRVRLGIYGSVVARDQTTLMPLGLTDERKTLRYLSTIPMARDIVEEGIKEGGRPYGIGLWNAFYLKKAYGNTTVQELKRRKRLLDTDNIMNPGKFFHAQTRFGFSLSPFLYGSSMRLFKLLRFIIR